jgi:hypothetical protein
MKTKFGAIIVAGSGKVGGHVASRNRAGSYLRTKVTPVNPRTGAQLAVRNLFTGFSQGWRGLTDAQRQAWNDAVSDFARTDIFGDLKNPTGANLFQRLNNVLAQLGEAALTLPPQPAAVEQVILSSFVADVSDGTMIATFAPTIPANTAVIVRATAPQSPGKSFVKSEFRVIGVLPAATATGTDLATLWEAKFGSISPAGSKIFVEFLPVSTITGQTGSPSQASAIIQA